MDKKNSKSGHFSRSEKEENRTKKGDNEDFKAC